MRSLLIAGAAAAAFAAPADAQRMVAQGAGAGYPAPGMGAHTPMPSRAPMAAHGMSGHSRWGGKVGGHWDVGMRAPGGWNGYRRPHRGWTLPGYWRSPSYAVGDWSTYGLAQPPYGYGWSRYYDDAVLIDGRGTVYDSVSDVDWDRYDQAAGYGYDDGYAGDAGYDDGVYADRGYPQPAPRYGRRDNGVGGAVTGAVVGGVAGNLIAGRGNRLGGTLIGAGVGAAAGYAIDKAEDRGRYAPPPPQAPYAQGYGAGYAPPPPAPRFAPVRRGEPAQWVSPDGRTSVVTTTSGGYYGTGVTTVTVQTAPVITTTTEVYEDTVTYTRPHKAYRKKVWHPAPRCGCR